MKVKREVIERGGGWFFCQRKNNGSSCD